MNETAQSQDAEAQPDNANQGQQNKGPKQPGNRRGPAGKNRKPEVVVVAPTADPAGFRRRHYGVLISFFALVVLPFIVCVFYLWARADDQYASSVAFTVREEGSPSAADMLGVFSQLSGGTAQSDTDVLYEYLQSQEMVLKIDEEFDLAKRYGENYSRNPLFSLSPDATLSDKIDFWKRIAKVSYNQSTRIMEIEVISFEPQTAQDIAYRIIDHSQTLINQLNAAARSDRIRYAEDDLLLALERLKDAREALILFRTQNEIVDLDADLEGRLGVVNSLQQKLADALVELDLLSLNTTQSDPRFIQSKNLTEVIRKRIAAERNNVVSPGSAETGRDYPTLLAEYESLLVDREYAEESYRAALSALDIARAEAVRQSTYLSPFLTPILPESAEYPRRYLIATLFAFFALMIWSILVLVYYSVRDSR